MSDLARQMREKAQGSTDAAFWRAAADHIERAEQDRSRVISELLTMTNRAERAERERDEALALLRDFADHGTRHDTCPTRYLADWAKNDEFWLRYFQQADQYVRERACEGLARIERTVAPIMVSKV